MFEAVRDWSWEVYRQVWYRIRQYWTEERWVRITDDERNMKWVALNKPITRGEQIVQQAREKLKIEHPELPARYFQLYHTAFERAKAGDQPRLHQQRRDQEDHQPGEGSDRHQPER